MKDPRSLTLQLHRQTAMAVLVSLDGVEGHAVWLAKSQIELAPEKLGAQVLITLPLLMAKEKGLLAGAGAGQGRLF